jgi:hypothetical protein
MAWETCLWIWRREDAYQEASQNDKDVREEKCKDPAVLKRNRLPFYISGLLAVSVLITIGSLALMDRTTAYDCGSTLLEAKARNCHFEPMQRAWIPHACYFPEPGDEYDPFSDRVWFLDATFETQADPEALKAGEVLEAYVADFHQEHCTYNWRKLATAVEKKAKLVDSRVGSVHHSTHCALGLAEQTRNISDCAASRGRTFTKSNLNFLRCVSLR